MQRPILVVEDNINDLDLLLLALERTGATNPIVTVSDGQQALDFLLRKHRFSDREGLDPEFVLLDIKLPRVNGLEVLGTMREVPILRTVPVIMLTSSSYEGDVLAAYDLGANGYVIKDNDFQAFVVAVSQISRMWAKHNEHPPHFRRTNVRDPRTTPLGVRLNKWESA
ncbi:response regulator [Caballeronia sp. LZ001]|uniref:response regulator n=1 Tax=Caballeronia sp. LZ001 TaxID=3038553 RepID=UPI0028624FAD|nr:response regulator [Caballeronia sp. LZ001]MDR5806404.1 response regulator [Caballeronia sp. LZ001]